MATARWLGAFLYGLLFAPIAVPCSGPFLVGIFAFSLTIGDALGRLAFFVSFGIGFGLPLFVLGSLGQVRGAQLARAISRHERLLQLVLGAALLALGVWDLTVNLPLIVAEPELSPNVLRARRSVCRGLSPGSYPALTRSRSLRILDSHQVPQPNVARGDHHRARCDRQTVAQELAE